MGHPSFGEHPLLGRRMPYQELVGEDGKTSTTDALREGTGVLFDLAGKADLRRIASAWAGRVRVIIAAPHELTAGGPLDGLDAVLVRPDGHVAWTGSGEVTAR